MRLVTTKVALLNIAALVGLALPVTDGLVPRLVFTGPPASRSEGARAAHPTGNIEVVVPRVPPAESLPLLCGLLLDSRALKGPSVVPRGALGDLYSATGGTEAWARSWCQAFISGQLPSYADGGYSGLLRFGST